MTTTIRLKNSVVKDKVPAADDLVLGEVAVGAHSESPALFFKDNADNIIKLEPGGSGVEPSPDAPGDPNEGDLWYDTGNNTLNYWNGVSWIELGQAGDSPVTSVNGEVGAVVLDAADVGALAPGDLISELENDLGFLEPGDNVSELSNDAGYLTGTDGDGFVDVDGDNMTGNLTLGTDKITLDASDGSASFAGGITAAGTLTVDYDANGIATDYYFEGKSKYLGGTITTASISTNGSAIFAGKVTANSFDIEALPALPA